MQASRVDFVAICLQHHKVAMRKKASDTRPISKSVSSAKDEAAIALWILVASHRRRQKRQHQSSRPQAGSASHMTGPRRNFRTSWSLFTLPPAVTTPPSILGMQSSWRPASRRTQKQAQTHEDQMCCALCQTRLVQCAEHNASQILEAPSSAARWLEHLLRSRAILGSSHSRTSSGRTELTGCRRRLHPALTTARVRSGLSLGHRQNCSRLNARMQRPTFFFFSRLANDDTTIAASPTPRRREACTSHAATLPP